MTLPVTFQRNVESAKVMREGKEEYGYLSTIMIHDDALYREIAKCRNRLEQEQIDLREAASLSSPANQICTFLSMFETELARITDYLTAQEESQELSAKALLTNIITLTGNSNSPSDDVLQSLWCQADEQVESCRKLHSFMTHNAKILKDVAEFADSTFVTSCAMLLQRRFLVSGLNSALVVVFSDIYTALRSAESKRPVQDGDCWVAPDSFERQTTKFWVEQDKLSDVLLLSSKEAPLLVYGKTGRLTTKADLLSRRSEGDKLWDNLATPISSVYFDSPTMGLFKSRITREEGSQLLRARWYGSRPEGRQPIFLELKTHHEKWVDEKSVKERVTIQAKDMMAFLAGVTWTHEDARAIVIAANPSLGASSLQTSAELLLTMHEMVVKLDLRPCVRSVYKRASFQSSQSNSLRLTVDRDVTLINESRASGDTQWWCLPDNAVIGSGMVKRLPYAVFEVKVSGAEMPAVFQSMEADGLIMNAYKFSKYLTGAALFVEEKLDKLPYWANHPAFAPLFDSSTVKTSCLISTSSDAPFTLRSAVKADTEGTEADTSSISSRHGANIQQKPNRNASSMPSKDQMGGTQGLAGARSARVLSKKPVRIEPKTYFANERTFIQWISGALLLVTVSAILLNFQGARSDTLKVGWVLLFCSAVIVCYAMFVYQRRLKLLASRSPYGYVDHIGPMILAGSVLIGIVTLLCFFTDAAIELGVSNSTAVLRAAPGYCIQHPLHEMSLLEYQPSDIVVDSNRLLIPSLSQITAVPLNGTAGIQVLVNIPGGDIEGLTKVGNRLFAISERDGTTTSWLVALEWLSADELGVVRQFKIPTTKAEGISFVPTTAGADDDGVVGELYVAGSTDGKNGEVFAIVDVYATPEPKWFNASLEEDVELAPVRRLNDKVLNAGIVTADSKVGALCYFEEVLFVLHDNARTIRAWDLVSGELLSEIPLPHVTGGWSDKQWEGLAFERQSGNSQVSGLRGSSNTTSSSSSLIMYLSLDSPSQVWSIKVQEGATKGTFTLPDCAGAI